MIFSLSMILIATLNPVSLWTANLTLPIDPLLPKKVSLLRSATEFRSYLPIVSPRRNGPTLCIRLDMFDIIDMYNQVKVTQRPGKPNKKKEKFGSVV